MKSFAYLILACFICAASVGGLTVWYAAISAKSAEVTTLQNKIDARTKTAGRLAGARATLLELAGDESMVRAYFVPESRVVPFIDAIEGKGRILGTAVQVLSVTTGGTTAKPVLELSVAITGTFDGVLRTIGAVEYAPYALSITGASINETAKNAWEATLTVRVGSRELSLAPLSP